jgi:hypothetical protein
MFSRRQKKRKSLNLREPFGGHAQRVQYSLACKLRIGFSFLIIFFSHKYLPVLAEQGRK